MSDAYERRLGPVAVDGLVTHPSLRTSEDQWTSVTSEDQWTSVTSEDQWAVDGPLG